MIPGKTLEISIWRLKVLSSWEIIVDLCSNHRFSTEIAVLKTFLHSKQWMENICKQITVLFFFSRVNISRAHANCHGIHMSLTESQTESQTDPVGDK